ncbi:MAG: hypothetical protein ACYS8L_03110 [Planctomycetota bacterium]|jgi:hypothetical protein
MGEDRKWRIVPPHALWNRAREFACAGALVAGKASPVRPASVVAYYLYAHAIELVLKAFLSARRTREADLRALGHDLDKVLDRCMKCGMAELVTLTPKDCEVIDALNDWYFRKKFEYAERSLMLLPQIEDVSKVSDELIQTTEDVVRAAGSELFREGRESEQHSS